MPPKPAAGKQCSTSSFLDSDTATASSMEGDGDASAVIPPVSPSAGVSTNVNGTASGVEHPRTYTAAGVAEGDASVANGADCADTAAQASTDVANGSHCDDTARASSDVASEAGCDDTAGASSNGVENKGCSTRASVEDAEGGSCSSWEAQGDRGEDGEQCDGGGAVEDVEEEEGEEEEVYDVMAGAECFVRIQNATTGRDLQVRGDKQGFFFFFLGGFVFFARLQKT